MANEENPSLMPAQAAQWQQAMADNTQNLLRTTNQIFKGYQNLMEVEEVDVATAPKETVWQSGKVKLYRYQREGKPSVKTPILVTYAMVNRFDMMDLQPDRSLIRKLLELGLDIYLIDWGYATRSDRYNTMEYYINTIMDDCVDYVRHAHKLDKINLLGVCQGGTFSLIYTALHPEKVNSLIPMVTPVDFSTDDGLLFRWSRSLDIDAIVDGYGGLVPGDFLNLGFDMLKPMGKVRKYNSLPNLLADKDKTLNFLRMEHWIADSPAQPGETYRKFIKDLYQENKLIKGEFELDGEKVDLKQVDMPVLNIYAAEDHLVPPSASIPLNDLIGSKDKETYEFPGGHIGVFVGGRSQKELGPTIVNWLKKYDK